MKSGNDIPADRVLYQLETPAFLSGLYCQGPREAIQKGVNVPSNLATVIKNRQPCRDYQRQIESTLNALPQAAQEPLKKVIESEVELGVSSFWHVRNMQADDALNEARREFRLRYPK